MAWIRFTDGPSPKRLQYIVCPSPFLAQAMFVLVYKAADMQAKKTIIPPLNTLETFVNQNYKNSIHINVMICSVQCMVYILNYL